MVECEHSKRKDRCKICKGKGICEHNKRKNQCKECGGSQICEHNILKYNCKICEGKGPENKETTIMSGRFTVG